MDIKITSNCYSYILSTVTSNGGYYSRLYNGYELNEMQELFKEYVIGELTAEILKDFSID